MYNNIQLLCAEFRSGSVAIYHELEKTKHVEILGIVYSIEYSRKKLRNLTFWISLSSYKL